MFTGKATYTKLLKVYKDTQKPVLDENGKTIEKPNSIDDPDYIPPYTDLVLCNPNTGTQTTYTSSSSTSSSTNTTTVFNPNFVNCLELIAGFLLDCSSSLYNVVTIVLGVDNAPTITVEIHQNNNIVDIKENLVVADRQATFSLPKAIVGLVIFKITARNCVEERSVNLECGQTTSTTTTTTTNTTTTSSTSTSTVNTCVGSYAITFVGVLSVRGIFLNVNSTRTDIEYYLYKDNIAVDFGLGTLTSGEVTLTTNIDLVLNEFYEITVRQPGCPNTESPRISFIRTTTTTSTTSTSSTSTTTIFDPTSTTSTTSSTTSTTGTTTSSTSTTTVAACAAATGEWTLLGQVPDGGSFPSFELALANTCLSGIGGNVFIDGTPDFGKSIFTQQVSPCNKINSGYYWIRNNADPNIVYTISSNAGVIDGYTLGSCATTTTTTTTTSSTSTTTVANYCGGSAVQWGLFGVGDNTYDDFDDAFNSACIGGTGCIGYITGTPEVGKFVGTNQDFTTNGCESQACALVPDGFYWMYTVPYPGGPTDIKYVIETTSGIITRLEFRDCSSPDTTSTTDTTTTSTSTSSSTSTTTIGINPCTVITTAIAAIDNASFGGNITLNVGSSPVNIYWDIYLSSGGSIIESGVLSVPSPITNDYRTFNLVTYDLLAGTSYTAYIYIEGCNPTLNPNEFTYNP